jgi:cell division topological specificity factor
MMKFLDRLTSRRGSSSGKVAKERLRLVLAHDRAHISPGLLDTLKDEIIDVISQHIDIDANGVQVTISESTRESRLVADIPLTAGRRRRRTP